MTKKQFVEDWVLGRVGKHTVNSVHFALTGVKDGVRWHKKKIDVSKSTVRRALESLVVKGYVTVHYEIGHAFDEAVYTVDIPF